MKKLLDFGTALNACKKGCKITRLKWANNNKIDVTHFDKIVIYQKGYPNGIMCDEQTANAWGMNEGDLFKCEPYLQMQTNNGSHAMWNPKNEDLLSLDWYIYEQEDI